MDDFEQRQRAALKRLTTIWRNDWTTPIANEYHRALADLHPTDITAAVDHAIRTRTIRPTPAQLREAALDARAERDAHRRDHVTTIGVGCPRCRDEHGAGIRDDWIAIPEKDLVSCPTHRHSWRGVLPQDHTSTWMGPRGHQKAPGGERTVETTNHPPKELRAVRTAYSASTGEAA